MCVCVCVRERERERERERDRERETEKERKRERERETVSGRERAAAAAYLDSTFAKKTLTPAADSSSVWCLVRSPPPKKLMFFKIPDYTRDATHPTTYALSQKKKT